MSPRLGRARLKVVIGLAALIVGMLSGALALFQPAAQAASVNSSCPQGTSEYKIDSNPIAGLSNGESAQFTVSGVTFTFTKVAGPAPFVDDTFDFTSTTAVSVVFVKAGTDTNVYTYDPAATSGSGLHPPLNGGGQAPAVSHVAFCIGAPGTTTTSTVPEETTTSTSTTTTVPDETTTSTSTTTTVPEETTTTTVPEETTTTTVPEETTTTTVPEETTTTTVPEETTTTTVPEETTTTTVPEETTTTTVPEETTTSTTTVIGSTTIATTTTEPESTTTLREQGSTVPTNPNNPTSTTQLTGSGMLPRTGSGSAVAAMFAIFCIAAGALMLAGKRVSRSRS
jgi:hypothetical protein